MVAARHHSLPAARPSASSPAPSPPPSPALLQPLHPCVVWTAAGLDQCLHPPPLTGPPRRSSFRACSAPGCCVSLCPMTKPQPRPIPRPTDVLSALPAELSARLFAKARMVSLSADETLFLAGDAGDGCYRVDEGLLKASILSPTGSERILAIFGAGRHDRRIVDDRRRTPLGVGDGAARRQAAIREPRVVRSVRRRQSGRLQASGHAARRPAARHQRRADRDQLPVGERPRRARAAQPRGGFRPRRRRRPYPGAPEGDAERPRRHGRHRPRERQPRAAGLDEAQGREPARRLLLHGGQALADRRSRSLAVIARRKNSASRALPSPAARAR